MLANMSYESNTVSNEIEHRGDRGAKFGGCVVFDIPSTCDSGDLISDMHFKKIPHSVLCIF